MTTPTARWLLFAIAISFAILVNPPSYAQSGPDPHLSLRILDDSTNGVYNPDSVMLDTNSSSSTFGGRYARQWFKVTFDVYAIDLPEAPSDTTLDVTWQAIDPTYGATRSGFEDLEQQFGSFLLRKKFPGATDPELQSSRVFLLQFTDPVSIELVEDALNAIAGTRGVYLNRVGIDLHVPNDPGMKSGSYLSEVQPGAVQTDRPPHLHATGWQWSIYSVQCPMAWEITKGSPDIVLIDHEWFGQPRRSHPDMGSYYLVDNVGDGSELGDELGSGHALNVLSMAIATPNNGIGIAGSGYNIRGLAMDGEPAKLDLDITANGTIKLADIVSRSRGESVDEDFFDNTLLRNFEKRYVDAIEAGMVVVAAVSNARKGTAFERTKIVNGIKYFLPVIVYPTAFAMASGPDASKDYRIISVAGITNGIRSDLYGREWWGIPEPRSPENHQGEEQFDPLYNFGPGTDKFNTSSDTAVRRRAKQKAFVDLCAPAISMIQAVNGPDGSTERARLYQAEANGTSLSSPLVGGIIGLMLSLRKNMSVDLDLNDDGTTDNGAQVQRTVYDILTFTADKIHDFNNVPTSSIPGESLGFITTPQYHYVVQTNDPLKRSWAQRVGFGKVNAYRAVAHTIANKGAYQYSTSGTLPFTFSGEGNINEEASPNTKALMHFGAWKNATQKVLEAGGVSLPGESHNNQGVTKVNGTGVTLTVPDKCILAIDGIVTTDNPTGGNKIVTANSGKICITGRLSNVAVVGTTRISDLTINGDNFPVTGRIGLGASGITSEIYGKVRLSNYGMIDVDYGTLRLQPGGSLELSGSSDLEITNGGTLELQMASKITTPLSSRQIIVHSGSNLVVKAGARADILCKVVIKSGATMTLEEGAVLNLDRFIVERNGQLILQKGSHLALNNTAGSTCYGRLHSLGTPEKRALITGKVGDFSLDYFSYANSLNGKNKITARTTILVQDQVVSPTDRQSCHLRLTNTDVRNVQIKTVNAPLYPITGVNFSGDRALYLPNTTQNRPLLNVVLTAPYASLPFNSTLPMPRRDEVQITSCTFSDENPGSIGGLPYNHIRYTLSGAEIQNIKRVSVVSSRFLMLFHAVVTSFCDHVGIFNTEFVRCNVGNQDLGSSLFLCQNRFESSQVGSALSDSRPGKFFANIYEGIHTGLFASASAQQDLRGNDFIAFMRGVTAKESIVNLAPRNTGPSYPLNEIYGRNSFSAAYDVVYSDYDPANRPHDIHLVEGSSNVRLFCGYNKFSSVRPLSVDRRQFHLWAATLTSVDVGYNEFPMPPGCTIKRFNIAPITSGSICTSATHSGCSPAFTTECTPPVYYPIDPRFTNDGTWPDLDYTDPYLDTAYTQSTSEMNDGTLTTDVRVMKARDVLAAAVLGSSPATRLAELDSAYRAISLLPAAPGGLKSAAHMLRGETLERLGDLPGARAEYLALTTSYTTSPDSIAAAWRIQLIDATLADTTYGDVWDSLMAGYRTRVYEDIHRLTTDTTGLADSTLLRYAVPNEPVTGEAIETGLSRNVPNPFSKETTIHFSLARTRTVRLEVVDVTGTIVATLVDGEVERGRHTAAFNAGALPAGTYYCHLDVDGQRYAMPIVVVR